MSKSSDSLLKTPLYALHTELGAKMVGFAGYLMPLQYREGIIHEHRQTRLAAGLFDISHMGQIAIRGTSIAAALERLVPSDLQSLGLQRQRYTVFTNHQGGIIDDCMISNCDSHFSVIANASRKQLIYQHLCENLSEHSVVLHHDQALLALQGPQAASVIKRIAAHAGDLPFLSTCTARIGTLDCQISRCGYTGEDGFEISVASNQTETLARLLLEHAEVEAIGLGARDTLRLEAGLCLYGHDIDEQTTPVEADLQWVIARKYRQADSVQPSFPGAAIILNQCRNGASLQRIGVQPTGRAPIREHTLLVNQQGKTIGHVTSGGFGPTVNTPIAMGYVNAEYAAIGTNFHAVVRDKQQPVTVVTLPFVPHRYQKGH